MDNIEQSLKVYGISYQDFYTLNEIHDLTGISLPSLKNRAKDGKLRARLITGDEEGRGLIYRVAAEDLLDFLDSDPLVGKQLNKELGAMIRKDPAKQNRILREYLNHFKGQGKS